MKRVLGVSGVAQHVAAEAEDARAVTVVEDLEGGRLVPADMLDQAFTDGGKV